MSGAGRDYKPSEGENRARASGKTKGFTMDEPNEQDKQDKKPESTSLDLSSDKDLTCPECGCLFSMMTSSIKQSGAYVKPDAAIIPEVVDDVTLPLFAEGVFENGKTEENNAD